MPSEHVLNGENRLS